MATTYRFTDETKRMNGATLHRIVALPGNKWVPTGTIGGWIERGENLSDGAWVADNAIVYGDALVYGNTLIEDDAQIYGTAQLHGSDDEPLIISWDLKIHGGDWTETPFYASGSVWGVNISSPDSLRIGCQDYTFERWAKKFPAIMRHCRRLDSINVTERTVREYARLYNEAVSFIKKWKYLVDENEVVREYRRQGKESINQLLQSLGNSIAGA